MSDPTPSSTTATTATTSPPPAAPPPSHTYTARCHCSAAAFTFALGAPLGSAPVELCNCTFCFARGYALADAPSASVAWLRGRDALKTYTFATGETLHRFCGVCGVGLVVEFAGRRAVGRDYVCVNVRCVEGEGRPEAEGGWRFDELKFFVSDQRGK